MTITSKKSLGKLFPIALLILITLFGTYAFAGEADTAFKGFYDFVNNMVVGYVGKGVALIALIGGAVGSGISGKMTLLVGGFVIAAALFFGPTIIKALLTATI